MFNNLTWHSGESLFQKYKTWLVYLLSFSYIAINAYLVYRDIYWSLMLPALLVLLWFYFYRLDVILLLVTAATPLAINVIQYELGAGMSLPTEPLLFGVLILFVVKLFYSNDVDPKIWRHPLSVLILLQLTWMLITSITSQIPLVSFKYLLSRLWFVIPFYFLGIPLFRKTKNIRWFMWLYALPLLIVIGYTVYNHYLWGFDEEAGHWVMSPFYNDHTVYGAILAMFIPVFVGFTFSRVYSKTFRFFSFLVLLILCGALFLSFSRAAWISLAIVLMVYLIILFRIKFKLLAVSALILGFIFFLFQNELFDVLEKNKQGTSANFIEHVQSITNISTDASNLERINRWQAAIRMYEAHPVLGFGPGTYQFEYAPYQMSQEKTSISTNAGDRGNAHSEYIGPLSEEGFPGMLFVVAIVVTMTVVGMRDYKRSNSREIKSLSLSIMLALLTYFLHGLMNNFLDSDKASVPVWAFIAMLVSINLYQLNKKEESVN
jgi:putative inorganic carbon (hco3(-)) transporter